MIKKGQVLKPKDSEINDDIEIMEIVGSLYAIKKYGHIVLCEIRYIEENYIIPAEKWVPEFDEIFFYVNTWGEVESTNYNEDFPPDVKKVKAGNFTKTKEESELNAEKFKEIFKK